jgi:hypothetical protein
VIKMARKRDLISGRQNRWKQAPIAVINLLREETPQDILDAVLSAAKDFSLDLKQNPKDGWVLLCILADVLYRKQSPWVASKEGRVRKRGAQTKWNDELKRQLGRDLKAVDHSGKAPNYLLVKWLKKKCPEAYAHLKERTLIRRFPPEYRRAARK